MTSQLFDQVFIKYKGSLFFSKILFHFFLNYVCLEGWAMPEEARRGRGFPGGGVMGGCEPPKAVSGKLSSGRAAITGSH